ncbi:MAG: hypothetical protein M3342_18340 [Bacteroidota bacterium]|nr:hypothetical protein [Bacteroidota bacterium]
MQNFFVSLIPEYSYHIFSHAIGEEKLFRSNENYSFFLNRFSRHVVPVADTFAWCLLPNHFHFLIRIKSIEIIKQHFLEKKTNKEFHPEGVSDFLMERFSNWLNSYTKAFNKMYNRKGALFMDCLCRVEIKTDAQLRGTVFYIHKNPVHHGLCTTMETWQWSSYHKYFHNKPNTEAAKEMLEWFGGWQGFIQYHQQPIYLKEALVVE